MTGVVRTEAAPAPAGPYSQGRVVDGILYIAGQGPKRPGQDPAETFEAQAVNALENLKAIVEAAGGCLNDVVKVNVYLAEINDWSRFNEVYLRYFEEPYPVRTVVQAGLLPWIIVEVDAIAHMTKG